MYVCMYIYTYIYIHIHIYIYINHCTIKLNPNAFSPLHPSLIQLRGAETLSDPTWQEERIPPNFLRLPDANVSISSVYP